MSEPNAPEKSTWSLLFRHQAVVAAIFLFVGTWAVQSVLDEHLQATEAGFPSGFLHALHRLDHFLAFLGFGLLCAGGRSRLRWAVPIICAALTALAVLTAQCQLPCATHSFLPVLFFVAAGLVLSKRAALLNLALLPAAWVFVCHLRSHGELTGGDSHQDHFATGLAVAAALSVALGMELGSVLSARTPNHGRNGTAACLLVVALALLF